MIAEPVPGFGEVSVSPTARRVWGYIAEHGPGTIKGIAEGLKTPLMSVYSAVHKLKGVIFEPKGSVGSGRTRENLWGLVEYKGASGRQQEVVERLAGVVLVLADRGVMPAGTVLELEYVAELLEHLAEGE